MAIENHDFGTVFTGADVIGFQLLTLRSALKLEIQGIKVRRGFSAYKEIKRRYGLAGTKSEVLHQFTQLLIDNKILVQE